MRIDSDQIRLEGLLERLMITGVASSAVCMVAGLAIFLTGAHSSTATAVVTAGLIILMATPALRVVIAVVEAIRMRDWFFLAVAGTVVVLLTLAMILALQRLS